MSGLKDKFSWVTGALGLKKRNFGAADRTPDHLIGTDAEIVSRQHINNLFELPRPIRDPRTDGMRQSEWLERRSMELIRDSLDH